MKKLFKNLCISALSATALTDAFCTYVFLKAFGRKSEDEGEPEFLEQGSDDTKNYYRQYREGCAYLKKQECDDVSISSYDGLTLCGRLYTPKALEDAADYKPTIILCVHGYHSEGLRDFAAFAPFYMENHCHLLIVDDRAHGRSEGKYVGFGYHDRFDCMSWIMYLKKRFKDTGCNIFLHGISMGSATVLGCCDDSRLPEQVKGIIADCGFSSAWDEVSHVLRTKTHGLTFPLIQFYNNACVTIGGYNLKNIRPIDHVTRSKVPILFIHGDADNYVPTSMVYKLYHACRSKKRLLIVPKAEHAMSYAVNQESYEDAVKDFTKRCLISAPADSI